MLADILNEKTVFATAFRRFYVPKKKEKIEEKHMMKT